MGKESDNIKEELQRLGCPRLVALQGSNPLQITDNHYFERNLERIAEEVVLYPLRGINAFKVPAGYFESLNERVSEQVALLTSDEAANGAEDNFILAGNPKVSLPYQVPQRYFERLQADFLQEEAEIVEEKKHAKVISFLRNVNKYVAAAIILVFFSIGSNFLLRVKEMRKAYNMLQQMDIHNALADVSTEEIFTYLNKESNKNIAHFADPNAYNNPLNIMSSDDKKENGISRTTESSKDDIIQYLNEEDYRF